MPEVSALEPFGDVQRLGVGMAAVVDPTLIVEAGGVDHQGIAVPAAHRIAHPSGIGVFGKLVAVQEDLPVAVYGLVKNRYLAAGLEDFERVGHHIFSGYT
jgi:hypothetical protein